MAKRALKQKQDQEQIEKIIKEFNNARKRPPTEDEIVDELDDDADIQKETISTILNEFQTVIDENVVIDKNDKTN